MGHKEEIEGKTRSNGSAVLGEVKPFGMKGISFIESESCDGPRGERREVEEVVKGELGTCT